MSQHYTQDDIIDEILKCMYRENLSYLEAEAKIQKKIEEEEEKDRKQAEVEEYEESCQWRGGESLDDEGLWLEVFI